MITQRLVLVRILNKMIIFRGLLFLSFIFLVENVSAQPCREIIWKKKVKNKLHDKCQFKNDTAILNYGGVYLHEYTNDSVKWYYFKRFYSDGTVVNSQMYCHYPTLNERMTIQNGNKSYYVVRNKMIIMQEYNSYEGYYFSFLNLFDNEIKYGYTMRKLNGRKKENSLYKTVYKFVPDQ